MRHPAASGKFADLPRIERGLGGKREAVEIARRREVGNLARHRDAPLILRVKPKGRLLRAISRSTRKASGLAQAQLALGSSWSRIAVSLSRGESGQQSLVIDGHEQPPPITRSCWASGRGSTGSRSVTAFGSAGHTAGDAMRMRRVEDALAPPCHGHPDFRPPGASSLCTADAK